MDAVVIEVYTRAGCHLCAVAEERAAAEAGPAELRLVDVDRDPELLRRYGDHVPVVVVDGREVARYDLPPGAVERAVAEALAARAGRAGG